MFTRGAAERPKGVLQALGQGHEALATEHNVGLFEARVCEAEPLQVFRRLAGLGQAAQAWSQT